MGSRQLVIIVLLGMTLFSANTLVMDAYAMTKADLIASISEKNGFGDTKKSKDAQCTVTDEDGNEYGSDDTNRRGFIHIKMRSSDGNLPTPMTLTCEKEGLFGSTTFEIGHKRFIKASLTMTPTDNNNPDSFFDVFFDVFTVDSFFDILAPLQDFSERTGGGDSFFDVFVEVDVFNDQQCPPGQFVIGIDSAGNIICDDLPVTVPDCSAQNHCNANGQCVADNTCQCDQGWGGFDCSVPDGGVCSDGQTQCGSTCVDTDTDEANCGACGNACSSGDLCTVGVCVPDPSGNACSSQEVSTLEACVLGCDGASDPLSCQTGCLSQVGSQCAVAVQQLGLCAINSGCPLDNPSDLFSLCLAQSCPDQWEAIFGDVTPQCPVGQTQCGNQCVSLDSDANNCGQCGLACSSGEICSNGICETGPNLCQFDTETRQCGTTDVGQCSFGTQTRTCDPNTGAISPWGVCIGSVDPAPEICGDNLDNDCDGTIDNGCSPTCETGLSCDYLGTLLCEGDTIQPDVCTVGICTGGQVISTTIDCVLPVCSEGEVIVTPAGECCPVCMPQ